jgi:signal peptidase II
MSSHMNGTGSIGESPRGGRLRLIAAIAGAVVALDAASKALATHFLAGHGRVEVLGGLVQLDLYRNFAGPDDLFAGHTVLISLFALLAVGVLAAVATRVATTPATVAVGLLLGGAVGNLLDRLFRAPSPLHGGVVDWLRLADRTKSMNVADLAIDAAIAVLLVGAILSWRRGRRAGGGGDGRGNGGEDEGGGKRRPPRSPEGAVR